MKKNFTLMLVSALVALTMLQSCASIVSKQRYNVNINSNPGNSKISIVNKKGKEIYSGNTPTTVKLDAGHGFFSKARYQVRISNVGYQDKIVPIDFILNGWYFGNILFGGLIGMLIVDPATGAMWRTDIKSINEVLTPIEGAQNSDLKIIDINDIPKDMRDGLVRIKINE